MKKYNVSLALKVYSNFEVEINAKTKKEALEIALEKYSNGEYDEDSIMEPDWANSELDIKADDMDNLDSGIHIEEIIFYIIFLDENYSNILLGNEKCGDKLKTQRKEIKKYLRKNPQNFWLNTAGFESLFSNVNQLNKISKNINNSTI